jgi:succinyl-CoA synthetase beta subunit
MQRLGSTLFSRASPLKNPVNPLQKRHLNLQEYQSKKLMDQFGVRTQKWVIAANKTEAEKAVISNLKAKEYVVKAQILAGGRGKGHFDNGFKGGVHLCNTPSEAGELVQKMIGRKLVTHQTGPGGVPVLSVMVAEAIDLKRELYVSIVMDRSKGGPVFVYSTKGGMDIEEVAKKDPQAIHTEPVNITTGPSDEQLTRVAKNLQFSDKLIPDAKKQLACLFKLFVSLDCTQVEVNPFAETPEGLIYCADAKINFDDNASFRQKEVFALHNTELDDPREVEATKVGINYVAMDGNIGCMVNGAGLAMATMDIIKHYGGEPANFLDVGGSASEEQVREAFRIITSDPRVKAILVNIFGGIMKCDVIANGVVNAAKKLGLKVPLIVRLEGTNVQLGKEIMAKSGLPIISATDLDDAAKKAVAALKSAK